MNAELKIPQNWRRFSQVSNPWKANAVSYLVVGRWFIIGSQTDCLEKIS